MLTPRVMDAPAGWIAAATFEAAGSLRKVEPSEVAWT